MLAPLTVGGTMAVFTGDFLRLGREIVAPPTLGGLIVAGDFRGTGGAPLPGGVPASAFCPDTT